MQLSSTASYGQAWCCASPTQAAMPKDALEALAKAYDEVLSKYPLDAAQDGPQNQIESKPAIEVESMESDSVNA